jgi:pyrimidine deaminase RibD-like protein
VIGQSNRLNLSFDKPQVFAKSAGRYNLLSTKSNKRTDGSAMPPQEGSHVMTPEQDLAFITLALDLSRESKSEDDGRIHPFVGAVIAHPDGHLISSGYRGQHTPGNHAEQEALIGIDESVVRGSVVYSTLEPCTSRGRQTACCLRLLNAGVAEVVIGILDPNPDIRGRGEYKFEFDLPIALWLLLESGHDSIGGAGSFAVVGGPALTGETRPTRLSSGA